MGIPVEAPPQTPIIVNQQQVQNQQQQVTPYSTSAQELYNGNQSNSESRSIVEQSPMSSNTQVNLNANNSHYGYGLGETHAVPVFTGGMRWNPNYDDFETWVGFSIPIGGSGSRISRDRQEARVNHILIENRFRSASGCASIMRAGIVIRYDLLEENDPLHECKTLIAINNIELPPPPSPSIEDFRSQWEEEKRKNALMEAKVNRLMLLLEQQSEDPFNNGG